MTIYAKYGTGPAGYYTVYRKRKLEVNNVVLVRPFVCGPGARWQSVRIHEICTVNGEPFYLLELW